MLSSKSASRGLTLVEVLIVMAIVGLLVSLSIPAIQASREAARRTHCISNLRQLGVALQSYHDVHHLLPPMMIWHPAGEPLGEATVPPGVIDRVVTDADDGEDRVYANWLCMLLPFFEESSLHSGIDRSHPIGHASNMAARATEIAVLKCPSDSYNGSDNHFQRVSGMGMPDDGYGRNNYAMNAGTNDSCVMGNYSYSSTPDVKCTDGYWVDDNDFEDVRRVWGSGIGGVNKSFAFREFPRGLSKMVAVDEIRAGINPSDPRGVWALGFVGASATAGHGIYRNAGKPNNRSVNSDGIANCERVRALAGGPGALAAMEMGCNEGAIPGSNYEAGSRSLHSNGANLMMLDGAVHFVENGIDEDVWHNMHRRDFRGQLDLPF